MRKIIDYLTLKDKTILYFINTKLNCGFFNKVMPHITHLGGVVFSVFFPIILILINKKQSRLIGFEILLSLSIGQILIQILKRSLTRERPYNILKNINTFGIELKDYSFPSGHTTAGFTTAINLSIYMPQLMTVFLFLASTVGISRIYLAVHYPSDVLAGLVIGVGVSFISHSYLLNLI